MEENLNPNPQVEPAPSEVAPVAPAPAEPVTQETSAELTAEDIGEMSDEELASRLEPDKQTEKPAEQPPAAAPEPSELDKLRGQLAEKEKYIQHRGNEIGQLRSELQRLQALSQQQPPVQLDNGPKQMTNEELTALWLEDPRKAYEALRTEEQQRELAKHEAVREKMDKLKSVAPDLTDYAIDITEVMKERDGFDEAYIKGLAENIDKLPPDMIYSYYDRARQHREIKSLKKEIESLKAKPARILDKIDKAQRAQFVTGSSGQTNPEGIMATTNIGDMSDKQLTEALRQRGIRI